MPLPAPKHDEYFKRTLQSIVRARALIRAWLPEPLHTASACAEFHSASARVGIWPRATLRKFAEIREHDGTRRYGIEYVPHITE